MYFTGIGTVVNVVAVFFGCVVGLLAKKFISEKIKDGLISGLALATFAIGLIGVVSNGTAIAESSLSSQYTLLMIISVVIGTAIGTWIDIEKRLDNFGMFCQKKFSSDKGDSRFAEGFVSASLLFCVGSMAIMGALNDGISHDPNILFAKSMLDCVMAMVYASTFGIGTMLSIATIIIYQGSITLCASLIAPFLTDAVIAQMSLIGNLLIMGIGLNFVYKPKFKVGNMLPAVFVPLVYYIIRSILNF
ncbi:MAG: DUF554 domain-containing protein [Clostridia bacterium]|nr:DUF554 domain-containing protein [Clostridia bacterium]